MAIARVQSKTANSGAAGVTTLNLVFDAAPTDGNIVVIAAAGLGTSSAAFSSMSVTGTNIVWMQCCPAVQGGSNMTGILAVGFVLASASATVTVTDLSSGGIAIAGAEYSGCAPFFDQYASAVATTTTPSSGATGTTSSANQLWVASIGHRAVSGGTFSLPTNSFAIVGQDKSSIGSTSDRSVALLERIVSGTGTANAGATVSASGICVSQVLTLKETPSGSAGGGSVFGSQGGVIT